jgi:hypothetical protein
MIIAAFKTIMLRKYSGYSIYFHNFSNFDAIFILKTLSNIEGVKLKPTYRDGKFLKLSVQFDKIYNKGKLGSKYQGRFVIYDSMLILPVNLEELGETLGGSEFKGFFPLKIINDISIPLDYESCEIPPLKYFYHPNPLKVKKYIKFLQKFNQFKDSFNRLKGTGATKN